jgi:hypothetical protein
LVVTLATDDVIDADRLVQPQRLGLVHEDAMSKLACRKFRIVAGILDNLLDWPHGNQVASAFVFSPEALPRRDNPEPISRQEFSEDPMVGMPYQRAPSAFWNRWSLS